MVGRFPSMLGFSSVPNLAGLDVITLASRLETRGDSNYQATTPPDPSKSSFGPSFTTITSDNVSYAISSSERIAYTDSYEPVASQNLGDRQPRLMRAMLIGPPIVMNPSRRVA